MRLLVTGDAVTHITQVSIAKISIYLLAQFHHLGKGGTFSGGRNKDLGHKSALQNAQQVIFIEGIALVQHLGFLLGRKGQTHFLQFCNHCLSPAHLIGKLLGKGIHQVALGDAALFRCHRKGKHILVIIQGDLRQNLVDPCYHLTVSFITSLTERTEELCQRADLVVGYTLDGHIANANLIRVIGAAVFQSSTGHRHPAFHTDGDRHFCQFCSLQKFLCTGNRVVVDNTGSAKAFHPGCIDSSGRRIGREGVSGVDVVIYVLGHLRRELGIRQDFCQIGKPLFLGRCVQQV